MDKKSKRTRPRRQHRVQWFAKARALRRVEYAFAASITLILSLFVSGVIQSFFIYSHEVDKNLQAQINIYQPKDAERHLYKINKLMRGLMN